MLNSILLIDDDSATIYIHQQYIQRLNIAEKVIPFTRAKEALSYLEQNIHSEAAPDLILLDLNMPIMNGHQFLEEYYRIAPNIKASPIIIVSSSGTDADINSTLSNPYVVDYLIKPVQKDQWLELAERYSSLTGTYK